MRRQLPAYSPLSLGALVGGSLAALGGAEAARRVERGLRDRLDARTVVGTDSGTTALRLALSAVAGARRLPIALPAYGCYDLATAAIGAGVPVALYDIDPDTLGPDPDELRALCAAGVAAIVVAHLFGIPVDMRTVNDVAATAGIPVIEDAAQGGGAALDGRRLGAWGSLVVLSFGRGKGTTGGRGGALLARDDFGVAALSRLAPLPPPRAGWGDVLRGTAQWIFGRPLLYGWPAAIPWLRLGETVYRSPHPPGPWSRAAVGMLDHTVRLADAEEAARRVTGRRLAERLPPSARCGQALVRGADPGYLRLPALVRDAEARHGLIGGGRGGRLGVAVAYPRALPDLGALGDAMTNPGAPFHGARLLADRLCTLPTHSRLAAPDILELERWIVHGL